MNMVKNNSLNIILACDPMHANTKILKNLKVRYLDDIIQEFKYDSLNDYENPTTTIDDIKELQKILAQCVINFVGEKNLKDIDEIHFSFFGW